MSAQFPSGRARAHGFSLIELLLVIGIIAMLLTMASVGVVAIIRARARAETGLTLQTLAKGFTDLKLRCEYLDSTPVGVCVGGRVLTGSTELVGDGVDFAAVGVAAGDRVFVLGSDGAWSREVTAVAGPKLTLDGAAFTKDEKELEYFVVRPDGWAHPRVHPARELDPSNSAWAGIFTPVLNARKFRLFEPPPGKIRDGWFRDPWGTPYGYDLVQRGGAIVERVWSAGADRKPGTADDIELALSEIPLAK